MRTAVAVFSLCCVLAGQNTAAGDRLQWTGGVTEIEGSAGGGLVPWALIGGLETNTEIGATAFVDHASTADFNLRSAGASLDLHDRVEISVARQRFDAGSVNPGLTLGQDILGVKVHLVGDAVFAPDEYLPQIAVGAQWKHSLDFAEVPRAVGAASGEDVEFYLAATKLYFDAIAGRNVILDATLRRTRANQFGLLGFGGNNSAYTLRPELSAAMFLSDQILLGAEYRSKPDNLKPFREDSARDFFVAWGPLRNVTFTTAWTDLGRIAGKSPQSGIYASLWVGF
ncbi:MAG TPA: DUF3034 family protein [Steroidobacteraceae bacterium]